MAQMLGYGQPMGGVAQTAFLVPKLEPAIHHWVQNLRAGPFFVFPHIYAPGQIYRGEESRADITVALGFAGHMLIELIQTLDDHPSVYREMMEVRGYGFHHVGLAFEDCDAASREYQARGFVEAYRAVVPTGGEVIYLDDGTGAARGFVELLPATPMMDEVFTGFWRASQGWDGTDPIRAIG